MKKSCFKALVFLPLLVACGGGNNSAPHALPEAPIVPSSSQVVSADSSEAQTDALHELQPLWWRDRAHLLYVSNVGNNSITVYRHDASGNAAPVRIIAGSRTCLNNPSELSGDERGNLYVLNQASYTRGREILVFAHGANGNVAPIRTLNPAKGFSNIEAMTVDKYTGGIFAFEDDGDLIHPSLLRFPPDAAGNTAPSALGVVTFAAIQLASDSTGRNLIESHISNAPSSDGYGIQTLAKHFANNTFVTEFYNITYFPATGLADDPTTRTYLATTGGGGIYRLAENTNGSRFSGVGTFVPPPVSIITSNTCARELAVGHGPTPDTYAVGGGLYPDCYRNAVYVYANNASGNATPVRILTGPATKFTQPDGIYEGR